LQILNRFRGKEQSQESLIQILSFKDEVNAEVGIHRFGLFRYILKAGRRGANLDRKTGYRGQVLA